MTRHWFEAVFLLSIFAFVSCKPAQPSPPAEDPYMIRMDFLERKLNELRDSSDRRVQDERTRRENQIAVLEKSLQDMERRLIQTQAAHDTLKQRVAELEDRVAALRSLPPESRRLPPSAPSTPPVVPAPSAASDIFPIEILNLTSLSVPVRTQASVRVIETGKMTRDDSGRRVPEMKTETYSVYEYEYRLRFHASNRATRTVSFSCEAGYGPTLFTLAAGEMVTNKEVRWKPGSSLLVRADGQYRLHTAPPPPPP